MASADDDPGHIPPDLEPTRPDLSSTRLDPEPTGPRAVRRKPTRPGAGGARPARVLVAIGLLGVAAGCGGPMSQLADQVPTGPGDSRVVGSPATVPPTTAAPPVVAPGARGGPSTTLPGAEPPPAADAAPAAEAPLTVAPPTTSGATTTTAARLAVRLQELNTQDATLFSPDTTSLDEAGLGLLEQVAAVLAAHPGVRVEVAGHTDTNGTPDSNLRISQQRAQAVLDRLVASGIAPDRLVAVGYGQTKPRATNDTVDGRALNRRIEFNVLG